jgi:hypothetical protein
VKIEERKKYHGHHRGKRRRPALPKSPDVTPSLDVLVVVDVCRCNIPAMLAYETPSHFNGLDDPDEDNMDLDSDADGSHEEVGDAVDTEYTHAQSYHTSRNDSMVASTSKRPVSIFIFSHNLPSHLLL